MPNLEDDLSRKLSFEMAHLSRKRILRCLAGRVDPDGAVWRAHWNGKQLLLVTSGGVQVIRTGMLGYSLVAHADPTELVDARAVQRSVMGSIATSVVVDTTGDGFRYDVSMDVDGRDPEGAARDAELIAEEIRISRQARPAPTAPVRDPAVPPGPVPAIPHGALVDAVRALPVPPGRDDGPFATLVDYAKPAVVAYAGTDDDRALSRVAADLLEYLGTLVAYDRITFDDLDALMGAKPGRDPHLDGEEGQDFVTHSLMMLSIEELGSGDGASSRLASAWVERPEGFPGLPAVAAAWGAVAIGRLVDVGRVPAPGGG